MSEGRPESHGEGDGEVVLTPIPAFSWFESRIGRAFEVRSAATDADAPESWRLAEARSLPSTTVPDDGAAWSSFSLLFDSGRHRAQATYRLRVPGDSEATLFCSPVLMPDGRPGMEAVVVRRT